MVLDSHTHIFPAELREGREALCEAEEDFRLLYANPKSRLVGARELVAYLDDAGIDAACTFGFPWADPGRSRLGNDYCIEAARRYPGRLLPFACVNPLAAGALGEADRCLSAGARGVGEIATYGAGLGEDVREALAPLAGLCGEAGVPLLLHTNEPVGSEYAGKCRMHLSDVYALVKTHPETTWILAHWGGGLFVYFLLKKEAGEVLGRCYFDTAAGPFLYWPPVYRHVLDIAGRERLLFGSDFPLLSLPRYRTDMDEAHLTDAERAAVLGGNLARLLGLDSHATEVFS